MTDTIQTVTVSAQPLYAATHSFTEYYSSPAGAKCSLDELQQPAMETVNFSKPNQHSQTAGTLQY